jgi:hypothetical protein
MAASDHGALGAGAPSCGAAAQRHGQCSQSVSAAHAQGRWFSAAEEGKRIVINEEDVTNVSLSITDTNQTITGFGYSFSDHGGIHSIAVYIY